MGTVAMPEMNRYKYDKLLSTGSIAAGGTLGFLIPPSIGFVVYGMLTEQSIGKLLVAGMIPGIALALAYILIVMLMVKVKPALAPLGLDPVPWSEKFHSLIGIWEPLLIFLIVMGGIYGGFFTPTEAGAIGATILFSMAMIKGKLTWQVLVGALREAARISIMVLFLVAGANVFSYFLALSTIPMRAAGWAASLEVSPYVILAVIIMTYLLLGCLLDAISMMVLTMPVVFPVIEALQFHPVWFGVIAVLMMEAGLITPPMGLNIYTVAGVAEEVPVETIFKGVTPFLIAIMGLVLLVTIFPQLALFLPKMMVK